MKEKKFKKKSHYIFLNKLYQLFIVILLFVIAIMCSNFFLVKGEKKCEPVKVVKQEVVNENVVFFGDSITDYYDLDKYFPDLKKVNSGISGNRTWDLKNDMYNRLYRYNPSEVVLLIGINNYLFDEDSIDTVMNDIKEIVENIHKELPYTKIIVQSLYPINDDWRIKKHPEVPTANILTEKILESNKQLKEYCKEKKYTYVDMFKELSNTNNEFSREYTDDGLHPNENGYKKITEVLKKYL
ncbi:MAG: hypothetical protein J5970_03045 [Bacilli bacterium]|nr:hypothetical protein [Bacilli bacterium]